MKVTARFHGYIRQTLAKDELELVAPDGSTIADVMNLLLAKDGKIEAFLKEDARGVVGLAIVVGGRLYPKSEWEKGSLADRAVIDFLPPASGGSQRECGGCWN